MTIYKVSMRCAPQISRKARLSWSDHSGLRGSQGNPLPEKVNIFRYGMLDGRDLGFSMVC